MKRVEFWADEPPGENAEAMGMQPTAPAGFVNGDDEAEHIIIRGPLSEEAQARLFDEPNVRDEVQLDVQRSEWRWFEDHPGRSVLRRRGVPGEVLCVINNRDDLIIESRLRPDGFIESRVLSEEELQTIARLGPN